MKMLISDKLISTFKEIIDPGTYSNYRKQKIIHQAKVIETVPVTVNSIYELDKKSDLMLAEEDIKQFASEKFAEYLLNNMSHIKTDRGEVVEHKYTILALEELLVAESLKSSREEIGAEFKNRIKRLNNKIKTMEEDYQELLDKHEALEGQFEFMNMEVLTAKQSKLDEEEKGRKDRKTYGERIERLNKEKKSLVDDKVTLKEIKSQYEEEGIFKSFFRKIKKQKYGEVKDD
jgi:hypothetical protein